MSHIAGLEQNAAGKFIDSTHRLAFAASEQRDEAGPSPAGRDWSLLFTEAQKLEALARHLLTAAATE